MTIRRFSLSAAALSAADGEARIANLHFSSWEMQGLLRVNRVGWLSPTHGYYVLKARRWYSLQACQIS